jgi:hypothetical protein
VAQSDLRRVERAARRSKAARTELHAAILAAWKSGESYKDIAHAAGLSKGRIGQIVKENGRGTE